MFETYDFEYLIDKMLSNVSDDLDKREGSVIYDAIAPAALELANFYIALDMVMDEAFAESASYYYLTKRAAERGLIPKEETNAILQMEVVPAETPIRLNDRFSLGELNYIVTSIVDDSAGIYQVQCESAGVIGNQQLGELLPIETENELNDMESATLTEVLIPGEDEEDVETFRERYFASFADQAFGGNKADYTGKVNDIDGIGGCKIKRAWSGGYNPTSMIPSKAVQDWFEQLSTEMLSEEVYNWLSTVYNAGKQKLLTTGGTVKITIINSNWRKPSATLIQKVQELLDPVAGEGDGLAPIGHVTNVVGVNEMTINVMLAAEFKNGYSFVMLKESIETIIDSYFYDLCQSWCDEESLIIRTSLIEARLLELEGIVNINGISLNGQEGNIALDEDSIPVRGDVSAG